MKDQDDLKKFTVERCKKILTKNGAEYTDEQVQKIRDFLYAVLEIEYQHYMNSVTREPLNSITPRTSE